MDGKAVYELARQADAHETVDPHGSQLGDARPILGSRTDAMAWKRGPPIMNSEDEQMDGRLIRAMARAEVRTRDRIIRLLEAEDLLDAGIQTLRPEERLRIVAAAECQAQLADAALKLQERSVVALERQAAALEALVAFAQKRGRGWASTLLQQRRLKRRR
ncbi:hypothetical protein ABIA03_000042 [Bradyrhizobium yuanmingense]|uniref:Periplasmic heavy metal sensor n=2 Tax=Bradyrhizobium yuanmingense TaxID=108015 RepID=A0ABV4G7I1_9BRAD